MPPQARRQLRAVRRAQTVRFPAAAVVPATRARADLSPWTGFDHENSGFVKYRSEPLTDCTNYLSAKIVQAVRGSLLYLTLPNDPRVNHTWSNSLGATVAPLSH